MWSNDELHRRYQAYLDQMEQEIDEGRRAEGSIQTFEEFESEYEQGLQEVTTTTAEYVIERDCNNDKNL